MVAGVHLAKEEGDEALDAATESRQLFQEVNERKGEAMALHAIAVAHLARKRPEESQRASRHALEIYRELGDRDNERLSLKTIESALVQGTVAPHAKFAMSAEGVAVIELDESASQESLASIIEALHESSIRGSPGLKCIVMYLYGSPRPPALVSPGLRSGYFYVGMRALGVPIVTAVSGRVSGPAWGLLLASDYKIAANATTFELPVTAPPAVMCKLLHSTAAELTITRGQMSSLTLMDMGVLQECRPKAEEAKRAALETGKRMSVFPQMACRDMMGKEHGPDEYVAAHLAIP